MITEELFYNYALCLINLSFFFITNNHKIDHIWHTLDIFPKRMNIFYYFSVT